MRTFTSPALGASSSMSMISSGCSRAVRTAAFGIGASPWSERSLIVPPLAILRQTAHAGSTTGFAVLPLCGTGGEPHDDAPRPHQRADHEAHDHDRHEGGGQPDPEADDEG